jgi:hypothetical protein
MGLIRGAEQFSSHVSERMLSARMYQGLAEWMVAASNYNKALEPIPAAASFKLHIVHGIHSVADAIKTSAKDVRTVANTCLRVPVILGV